MVIRGGGMRLPAVRTGGTARERRWQRDGHPLTQGCRAFVSAERLPLQGRYRRIGLAANPGTDRLEVINDRMADSLERSVNLPSTRRARRLHRPDACAEQTSRVHPGPEKRERVAVILPRKQTHDEHQEQ